MAPLTKKDDPHCFSPSPLRSCSSSSTALSQRRAVISSSSASGSPSRSPHCFLVSNGAARKNCRMHKERQPQKQHQGQPHGHIREQELQRQQEQERNYLQQQIQQQQQPSQRQPRPVLNCFPWDRFHALKNRGCQAVCFAAALMVVLALAKCSSISKCPSSMLSVTPHPDQAAAFPFVVLPAASWDVHMQSPKLTDQQKHGGALSFLWGAPARNSLRFSAATPSFLPASGQAPPRRLQAGIYTSDQDRARKGQVYLWLSVALVAILVMAIMYTLKIANVFDPLLHTRFTPSDRTR